ncbi:MAG: hypothetical protein RI883_1704 [Bacteroidota bacterium]|jgi:hypothetical protein
MKKILSIIFLLNAGTSLIAQIQSPKSSPISTLEQRVGLTDVKIEYSRPSKNDREIFGKVVPFNEIWRTGANENTKITLSDAIVFGKDTLQAGTYAIFTKPLATTWEIIFYSDIANWGTPDEWDDKKVVLKANANVIAMNDVTETFTIGIDNTTANSANLNFTWDKTRASVSFSVPTAEKMAKSIEITMAGPTAGDYHASAEFYYKEKMDLKQALEWSTKACDLRGDEAFWMLRLKSLIQADLGDYKGAIETAKRSLASAETAKYQSYIDMNKASIEEWGKKKK